MEDFTEGKETKNKSLAYQTISSGFEIPFL
jgi:hypothetical protein